MPPLPGYPSLDPDPAPDPAPDPGGPPKPPVSAPAQAPAAQPSDIYVTIGGGGPTPTVPVTPQAPDDPETIIRTFAKAQGIDPDFAVSIAKIESGLNPNAPRSKKGAIGIMQLMPDTATQYKVNPFDIYDNIRGGVTKLRDLQDQYHGNPEMIARRYNGTGRETSDYARKVLGEYERLKGITPGTLVNQVGDEDLGSTPEAARNAAAKAATPSPTPGPGAGGTPKVDPFSPEGVAATVAANKTAVGPEQQTVAAPPPQPPHPQTWWEKWTGTTSDIPADVQKQITQIQGVQAQPGDNDPWRPGPYLDDTRQNAGVIWDYAKQQYDPRTPEGRRNIAGTAGAMALGPLFAAAAPAELAGSMLWGIGSGALGSAIGGGMSEATEQMGAQKGYDTSQIAGAAGQQAEQDVLGHILTIPVRGGLRVFEGPGMASEIAEGFQAERGRLNDMFRKAAYGVRQSRRALGVSLGNEAATRAIGTEASVAAARDRAQAALDAGKATTERNVGVARDAAAEQVADANAASERAKAQAGAGYQRDIGTMPDETEIGQGVADTLKGPAKAELDALGEASDAAARAGPVQDISKIQKEAERIVKEEILPPEQSLPRQAPKKTPKGAGPPAPPSQADILAGQGAPTPSAPTGPPKPPANSALGKRLQAKITKAEEDAVSQHPVMATINRLLNAKSKVRFADLAALLRELGTQTDFDSPVADKMNGIRKHLYDIVRTQMGEASPAWDEAATKYAEGRRRLTDGYAGEIARTTGVEPARAIQMISPDDPKATATLMDTLTKHNPELADKVRQAWLYRNVLQGGIEGLAERMKVLRDRPQFTKALFGDQVPSVYMRLDAIADGWEKLNASAEGATAAVEARTAKGVDAAQALGKQRTGSIARAGAKEVGATRATGKAADRAAQEAAREARKEIGDQLAAIGEDRALANRVSDQEALAIKNAQSDSQRLLNLGLGVVAPTHYRGVIGWVKMLTGPRSRDLLAMAANRPGVNRMLLDWMANPNARVAYQAVKHLIGQPAEHYVVGPGKERLRESSSPTTQGGVPYYTAAQPPPAPPGDIALPAPQR